jgi:hypothetical protein
VAILFLIGGKNKWNNKRRVKNEEGVDIVDGKCGVGFFGLWWLCEKGGGAYHENAKNRG